MGRSPAYLDDPHQGGLHHQNPLGEDGDGVGELGHLTSTRSTTTSVHLYSSLISYVRYILALKEST